jgi:hypothetical protein
MLLWPVLVAVAFWSPLLASRIRASQFAEAWLPPLGLVAALWAAYWGIVGTPFEPFAMDAKARWPTLLLVGLVASGLPTDGPPAARYLLLGVLSVASMRFFWGASIAMHWSLWQAALYVTGLGSLLFRRLRRADRTLTILRPKAAAAYLGIVAGLPAPLMLFGDSLVLSQLHGAIGLVTTVGAFAVWTGTLHSVARARYVVIVSAFSLWSLALLFGNVEGIAFFFLVAGLPLSALIGHRCKKYSPGIRELILLGTLVVTVGLAIVLGSLRYHEGAMNAAGDDMSYGYQ